VGTALERPSSAIAAAYNFAKRLKTLKALTACEDISKCWQNLKERFKSLFGNWILKEKADN
jgi:hypothetical protein